DVAFLWWHHRSTDEKRGGNTRGTWEEIQRESKKQFYPQYAKKETQAKLRRPTQQGTVREYVQPFSEQGIIELTVVMAEVKSFIELGPTKDKFELSKPNGKGNGERNHKKDKEKHSDDGNSIDSTSGNGKPRDAKRGLKNPRDKGNRIKCFLCQGPHMARKCSKKSMILAIEK
ncbi:hypothetical protein Golob_025174, partial [Gossypium lobatum]|nr:hypothetical protein [Gossypium lobatum]